MAETWQSSAASAEVNCNSRSGRTSTVENGITIKKRDEREKSNPKSQKIRKFSSYHSKYFSRIFQDFDLTLGMDKLKNSQRVSFVLLPHPVAAVCALLMAKMLFQQHNIRSRKPIKPSCSHFHIYILENVYFLIDDLLIRCHK